MVSAKEPNKIYNFVLREALYNELQVTAHEFGIPVVQLVRKFITFGLAITKISLRNPEASVIIREGDTETQIVLF